MVTLYGFQFLNVDMPFAGIPGLVAPVCEPCCAEDNMRAATRIIKELFNVLLAGVSVTVAAGLGKKSKRIIKRIAINAAMIPKRRRRRRLVGGRLPVPGPYEPAVSLCSLIFYNIFCYHRGIDSIPTTLLV